MKHNKNKKGNFPILRFPEFEGEWEERKLGEVCAFVRGPFGSALKKEFFVDEGYAVYEQSHAIYGDFSSFRYYITSEKFHELIRFAVKSNDLIMSCSGTMGKFSIIPSNTKEGVINQALLKLTVESGCHHEFIKSALELPSIQNKLLAQSAGGAIKNIVGMAELKEITLSIPKLEEQEKIATFLSLIDKRIETQKKIIEGYESLIKGLSHRLFKNNKAFNKKKLGSLCIIKKGHQINAIDLFDIGKYYVMNGGVNPSGYYDNYNTEADTISISEGGNSCGYVQYNDSKFWSGGHCYTLEDIDKQIVNQYLYFYLKSEQEKIMALRVGSGLPNIQKKDLERLEVNYPNIEKQNQITNFLSRIDAKLELEKSLLLKYNEQKQYLLDSLFI